MIPLSAKYRPPTISLASFPKRHDRPHNLPAGDLHGDAFFPGGASGHLEKSGSQSQFGLSLHSWQFLNVSQISSTVNPFTTPLSMNLYSFAGLHLPFTQPASAAGGAATAAGAPAALGAATGGTREWAAAGEERCGTRGGEVSEMESLVTTYAASQGRQGAQKAHGGQTTEGRRYGGLRTRVGSD